MDNRRPPLPSKDLSNKMKLPAPSGAELSNWTLSYRLQGMAIGLIAASIYCYVYLQYWSKILLISAGISGYFIGWVVGYWLYKKKS